MNEQLVMNIVRFHYRDPVFFLDVASVTATMKLDMSAGLDLSEIGLNGGSDIIKYSLGVAYETSPTISYAPPHQGEGFVKSVLSPIPIEAVFSLWWGRGGMLIACFASAWSVSMGSRMRRAPLAVNVNVVVA